MQEPYSFSYLLILFQSKGDTNLIVCKDQQITGMKIIDAYLLA